MLVMVIFQVEDPGYEGVPTSSDSSAKPHRSLLSQWPSLSRLTRAAVGCTDGGSPCWVCPRFLIPAVAFWFLAPLPVPKVLAYTPLTSDRVKKFDPLVTDGSRLYFMTPAKIGWTLAEVSVSGGETAPIDSHFDDIQLGDISPSGSELLIRHFSSPVDVPIYVLPLPAGLPRRVGEIVGHDASWSPNGEEIVYARGNDLFLSKPDSSESRRLVTLTASASQPRWSPDGKVCALRRTIGKPILLHCGR